jgi:hypothetical protein
MYRLWARRNMHDEETTKAMPRKPKFCDCVKTSHGHNGRVERAPRRSRDRVGGAVDTNFFPAVKGM